jgi:hypothetical protein
MSSDDEVLRAGFTAASELVGQARLEADAIMDEANRRADLMVVKAERAAAAKRSEAEIYLQKARAVLEIAHQRASNRPQVLPTIEADPIHEAADQRLDLTLDRPRMTDEPATAGRSPLPEGFDRLLGNAVSAAVANSVASTRR